MSSLNTVATQQKYGLIKKNIPIQSINKRKVLQRAACFDELEDSDSNDEQEKDSGVDGNDSIKRRKTNTNININSDINRVNKSLMMQSKANELNSNSNALVGFGGAEAAVVGLYDYDGYLEQKDTLQSDREKEQLKKKEQQNSTSVATSASAPKASYIHNLKSAAIVREKEKDRIFEKKLLKERLLDEENMEAGLESKETKFVTSAYKKKLMEQKKWEHEDR